MNTERKFQIKKKVIKASIATSDLSSADWESVTTSERDRILKIIDEATHDLVVLRRRIKEIPVVDPPGTLSLKPGLTRNEAIAVVDEMIQMGWHWREKSGWENIYLNSKTGQAVYTKLGAPGDDGYLKGFQLALDLSTNQMVVRNCDNIHKSLDKKGFKRVEMLDWFKTNYHPWEK